MEFPDRDNKTKIKNLLKDISTKHYDLHIIYDELYSLLTNAFEQEVTDSRFKNLTDFSENDTDTTVDNINDESLEDYLSCKGLTVQSYYPMDTIPSAWSNISSFIAENYSTVEPFIHLIKKNQSSQSPFTMNLKSYSQNDIAKITNLAHLIYNCGLIPYMFYFKSPRYQLRCNPPNSPDAINYFTCGWIEIYIMYAKM